MSDENGVVVETAQAAPSTTFSGLTVNEKVQIREGAVIKGFMRKPGKPFSDPHDDRNFIPYVPKEVPTQTDRDPGETPVVVRPVWMPKFITFAEFMQAGIVEVVMSQRIQSVLGSYGDGEGQAAGHTIFSLMKKSYMACEAAYREGCEVFKHQYE